MHLLPSVPLPFADPSIHPSLAEGKRSKGGDMYSSQIPISNISAPLLFSLLSPSSPSSSPPLDSSPKTLCRRPTKQTIHLPSLAVLQLLPKLIRSFHAGIKHIRHGVGAVENLYVIFSCVVFVNIGGIGVV
jgi:hypothetical protein